MVSQYCITNSYKISATQTVSIYLAQVSESHLGAWGSRLGPTGAKPLRLGLLHFPPSSGTRGLVLEFSPYKNHWHVESILNHALDFTLKSCLSNQIVAPKYDFSESHIKGQRVFGALTHQNTLSRGKGLKECFKWLIISLPDSGCH